ncbi:hypothetical protein [Pontixanthobacter sp.]
MNEETVTRTATLWHWRASHGGKLVLSDNRWCSGRGFVRNRADAKA